MENGNVTTYEWIHGEAPLRIEKSILDFGTSQEDEIQDKNIEIDFDCLDLKVNSMVSDHIEVELEAPTEIDWGDLEIAADNVDIDKFLYFFILTFPLFFTSPSSLDL